MADKRVTLDDVAKLSGVSRATASRALNLKDGVADDVRERVRLIAESLNYRPNRAAKNLAGGRSSVIGLVLGSSDLVGDRYTSALIQSMARACSHFDQGLMLLMTSEAPGQAVRRLLGDGLVDGIVVRSVALGEPWVEELLDANVKSVLIGSHHARPEIPRVATECSESVARMVEHLFDTGCSRLATITGPLDRIEAQSRLRGFRLANERRGVPIDESLIVSGDYIRASGYARALDLLKQRPDAIVAANDAMAEGTIIAARELGLSVPQDLSVIGFDGVPLVDVRGPSLTTLIQPFDELAMRSMQLLLDLMDGTAVESEYLLAPKPHFGDTTRSPDPTAFPDAESVAADRADDQL